MGGMKSAGAGWCAPICTSGLPQQNQELERPEYSPSDEQLSS
jgi:hypothetical protein